MLHKYGNGATFVSFWKSRFFNHRMSLIICIMRTWSGRISHCHVTLKGLNCNRTQDEMFSSLSKLINYIFPWKNFRVETCWDGVDFFRPLLSLLWNPGDVFKTPYWFHTQSESFNAFVFCTLSHYHNTCSLLRLLKEIVKE